MGNEQSKSISGSKTKKKESLLTELKDKLHLHGQSCESKCETLNKPEQVAATDSPGAVDLSADPNNTANEGKLTELEQILEQKTFTRSEIDRLTSILHSRIVDISLEDKVKETAAASNSFGHPHKNNAFQMSVHEPILEEGATVAEFHNSFADIQNLLKEKTREKEASSSSQDCLPSLEEVSHAKKVLNECFSSNFANVMQTRRKIELRNAFSTMCHVFADTKKVAVEVTKFVADFDQNCEQYVVAQEDIEEAKEKENLVGELKTSSKQLYDVLIPVLDRAKEIEREIVKLERKLGERKEMKAQIKDDLEGLAGRASSSKQALIDAEQEMKLFMPKKEQAQTMIDDIENSWMSFKSLSSSVLKYSF